MAATLLSTMRLGISLPYTQPDGSAPSAVQLAARAQLIESIGFDVIAQGDHVGSRLRPTPDVLTWLSIAAAATHQVQLASGIIQVPLRHPAELANRLISLHAVSGGRFVAGLGAGSTRSDYDAVGVDYTARFKILRQDLPVIQALCRGQPAGAAYLHPWQNMLPGPPILIGAWASGQWVRHAARDYDGWMASGHTTFREIAEGIRIFRDYGGKRAMLMTVAVDLRVSRPRLSQDDQFTLACEPAEAAEWLHRLAELGYDDVCLQRFGHTEATLTADDLRQIRSLLPASPGSLARHVDA
jgi:alkanesulfonate monooxygenase SsuD/methylene tetrahydromethanopterin reductase-like flavin-dependent oxidoreductase (luciferase family)